MQPCEREGFAAAQGPCQSGSPPLLMASLRAGLVSQRVSDMIGWRFKTAAHSSKILTKRSRVRRLARRCSPARESFAAAQGPCQSGSPPLLMAAARAGLVSQRGSDMSGWRFKTAAHSSKMLTKRHRLYRLARQSAQAREGFAVAPGPYPSGPPPLLMAAVRAGLVSQRGSDMSGWRFKTAAHSSKILTKLSRAWRLARQCSPARERALQLLRGHAEAAASLFSWRQCELGS